MPPLFSSVQSETGRGISFLGGSPNMFWEPMQIYKSAQSIKKPVGKVKKLCALSDQVQVNSVENRIGFQNKIPGFRNQALSEQPVLIQS